MPFIQFRDKDKLLQQRMMIYEMRRKGMVSPGESEVDKFQKELEDERRWKAEEARKEAVAGQQITASQEESARGQQKLDVETDLGYKKDWRGERALESQNVLRGRQGVAALAAAGASRGAEAASRAHAGLFTEETLAKSEERQRNAKLGMLDIERRANTVLTQQLLTYKGLNPEQTNRLEKAQRALSDNDKFELPRKEDGSLDVANAKDLLVGVIDEKGNPTAAFAKDIKDLEKPYTDFASLLADANTMRLNGVPPSQMQNMYDKIWKEVAPTGPGQVEGDIMRTLLYSGNVDGALDIGKDLRNASKTVIKVPDPKEREERQRQVRMIDELNKIDKEYQRLKVSGRIPVTAYKQPLYDALAYLGRDDQHIETFRKKLENFQAKYLLYLSGRAATDQERAGIKKQIPSRFDSMQTFELAMPEFRNGIVDDIAVDNGLAEAYGTFVDPNLPKKSPMDVIKAGRNLPNYVTKMGTIPAADVTRHVLNRNKYNEMYNAAKEKVGGGEERRQYSPGVEEKLGYPSVSDLPSPPGAPGLEAAPEEGGPADLSKLTDEELMARMEELRKLQAGEGK